MQTTLQRHHARTLRKNMTGAERVMWNHLKGRALNGYRFNRQVEIGPFIADFLCREIKVVVEIDGPSHSGKTTDQLRTAYLEERGYVVFRAWNNEIYSNLDGVLKGLLLVLESRAR
jgi:very-short-patch-repair endonuclease